MPVKWGVDPRVEFVVVAYSSGPLDPPFSGQAFNLTDHAGVNYLDGDSGISVTRGRSDEFQAFQAGECSFTLRNNGREFDPSRTEIAADLPAVSGATITTPDHAALAPNGDLYVRVRLSMDNWVPGGFGQFVLGQWPNSAGNNGWVFMVTDTGALRLSFTQDGSTGLDRTSTQPTGFKAGSVHWVDVSLDVNNGAAGHTVTFRTSEDGLTWTELGAPVVTAGTVTLFNSTAVLAFGDILPLGGQVYEADVRIGGMFGSVAANPRISALEPDTVSFTDGAGRVWTVNGTATVGYDDHASIFAPILKPRRQVAVYTVLDGDLTTLQYLFAGVIDGWPETWGSTTGSVPITAHDLLSILAQTDISEAPGGLVLDSAFQGQLDQERLAGDLPQQFTGERIETLIQFAGLSTQPLSLDTGLTEVAALVPTGDVLGLCQEAEEAEAGFLYVDRSGDVMFLDRHSRFQTTRIAEIQATFTDTQYTGLSVDYSTTQMWNDARFTRPAIDDADMPHEATQSDEVSIHENGRKQYRKTIPVVSDGETLARAQFWVSRYGRPRRRPSPITIRPRKNLDALFLPLAGMELLDRIQLVRTPLGIDPAVRFTGLVQQIGHEITKDDWVCTLATSPIDIDDGLNYLVLDGGTLGQLDEEVLSY